MRLTGMTLRAYAVRVAVAFVSGALIGMALMGWHLAATTARQNKLMGEALDQVAIARKLNEKCQAAIEALDVASWYGARHEGRDTASGEAFRAAQLTAAHRDWPLGERLRVRSLRTGLAVTVRINDRGPFIAGRGLDLSRAAAARIGMLDSGVEAVLVTRLGPGEAARAKGY